MTRADRSRAMQRVYCADAIVKLTRHLALTKCRRTRRMVRDAIKAMQRKMEAV